jgi:hypothetical protein
VRRERQKVNVFSTDEPGYFIDRVSVRKVGANNHIRGISLLKKGLEPTPPAVLR